MSILIPESSGSHSGVHISFETLTFDFPEADVIIRSRDSFDFRVLKIYVIHISSILSEKLSISSNPRSCTPTTAADFGSDVNAASLPVIQLPESGAIVFSLLSYVFPVTPILPATPERTMELLSVAQKYKMDVVLTRIRNHIAEQDPPFIREETAYYAYSLAQKYGLRKEALQAARLTLTFSPLTIEGLEDELDMMSGACLHELWKYHMRVKSNLALYLEEFRTSHAKDILGELTCHSLTPSLIPTWINLHIETMQGNLAFLDPGQFYRALERHVRDGNRRGVTSSCTSCADIPPQRMRLFWTALTTVSHASMTEAESGFLLVEGSASEGHSTLSIEASRSQKYSDMSNADVILRSIDLVNFRVHKSVLATSSPFFEDMFTLRQPHNTETIDGLPVVDLSEDAETLNSLMSMLYPVPPEIPKTNDNILALLAASEKFDMSFVQSSIRAQVKHKGLLSPKGAEAFRVYALACQKKLIPEMTTAAYHTMGYPFTFEYLGEALRSFEGWALRDLASFRQRCTDSLVSCFKGFLGHRNGPLGIWIGCPGPLPVYRPRNEAYSPIWLQDLFSDLLAQVQGSTYTLDPSHFRKEYSKALNDHISKRDCHVCARVHASNGEAFCLEITDTLAQAQDIHYSFWNTSSSNIDRNLDS